MNRRFASRVSSPRLKWVILVFWLVAAAASAPLAADLTSQQDNDIASWLPGDAESTVALEQQIALGSDPDVVPADIVAIAADARSFAELDELDGTIVGPIPAEDGQAAQLIVPINPGSGGWEAIAPI